MPTVAEFKIEHSQILDPKGRLVAELPPFAADTEEVLRMYRAMTHQRLFDAKAVNLQRTGQLGTYPSSLGHEATHIGVAAALRPQDVLAPVYREIGTQLWRGVTMLEILTYWAGTNVATTLPGRAPTSRGASRLELRPCTRPARRWRSRSARSHAVR